MPRPSPPSLGYPVYDADNHLYEPEDASLLARLERTARLMPWGFRESPRDAFRRNVWVAPFYEEDVPGLAEEIGVEHVLFGSDFPHPEGLAEPLSFLSEIEGMSEADTRRIMSENLAGLLT